MDLTNRVTPSVVTRIINKATASVQPLSDTIGIVGPAAAGATDTILTYTNPAEALKELGACRMTNQMVAAWAGGAGTIKVVRVGGTKNFDSVLYQDAQSPDETTFDISNYMKYRFNDIYDFYSGTERTRYLSPNENDRLGEWPLEDCILAVSSEKFDTLDIEFTAAPIGNIEIGYYNNDITKTMNGNNGFSPVPSFEMNGTTYLSGVASISGISSLRMKWDLEDVSDWEMSTFTDHNGIEHSGYVILIRRPASGSGAQDLNGWQIARISKRIGAEGSYKAFYPGTFDGNGVLTGQDNTLQEVFMLTALSPNEDDYSVTLKRVGPRVSMIISRVDSFGFTITESYTISPSVSGSSYVYSTEDLITEINKSSTLVSATDLSGVYTMFGWSPTSTITADTEIALVGGSTNLDNIDLKDYVYGLGKLARESDIYWVLPCIPDESIYKTGTTAIDNDKFYAIMQLFYTHVTNLVSGLQQRPRIMMNWLSPGYQKVGTVSNTNLNIKTGSSRRLGASDRVIYTLQALGFAELEGSGSLAYRREYLASFTAGLLAGLAPAVPGTRKELTVGPLDESYDLEDADVFIRNGVFIFADIDQIGTVVAKAITAKLNSVLSAVSARRISDRIAVDSTALLERRFIGTTLEKGTTTDMEAAMTAFLESKVRPASVGGLLNGFANVKATPSQVVPNKVNLTYDLAIKVDLDYIDQDIYLTNQTILVSLA